MVTPPLYSLVTSPPPSWLLLLLLPLLLPNLTGMAHAS
jgi:hypothetical protein